MLQSFPYVSAQFSVISALVSIPRFTIFQNYDVTTVVQSFYCLPTVVQSVYCLSAVEASSRSDAVQYTRRWWRLLRLQRDRRLLPAAEGKPFLPTAFSLRSVYFNLSSCCRLYKNNYIFVHTRCRSIICTTSFSVNKLKRCQLVMQKPLHP